MTQTNRAANVGALLRAACDRKAQQEGKYSRKGVLKPYTSYRLGTDANIDKAYAYKVLHGRSTPSPEILERMCKALDCSSQERIEIFHAAGYLAPEELEEESIRAA